MRLQEALDRFVVQLEADGRSRHTIEQYQRHIGLLARWLAQERHSDDVDELGHERIAAFLVSSDARGSRRGGPKRATSMNALRSSLRAFFCYVHSAGWSRQNPARLVRRARCAGGPPKGLSELDRERLLSTLASAVGREADRDSMLIHLLLESGIRLSSALALTNADVELEQGELTLRSAKGQRVDRVVLAPALRDRLAGYLAKHPRGFLFPSGSVRPMSRRHAARRLAIWMARAGCKESAHPHTLRHAFGQALYQRCGDPFVVQAALCHRSLASTLVYVRSSPDRVRAALSG